MLAKAISRSFFELDAVDSFHVACVSRKYLLKRQIFHLSNFSGHRNDMEGMGDGRVSMFPV